VQGPANFVEYRPHESAESWIPGDLSAPTDPPFDRSPVVQFRSCFQLGCGSGVSLYRRCDVSADARSANHTNKRNKLHHWSSRRNRRDAGHANLGQSHGQRPNTRVAGRR